MKNLKLYRSFVLALLVTSVLLYGVEYLMLGDSGTILTAFIGNLAFLPINVLLVYEWVAYMEYLKNNYPYLFSLSMRTNPFDREASPVVK